MKKTFLSMLLIGSSCALWAQVEETRTDTVPTTTIQPTNMTGTTPDTLTSAGNYPAYSAAVTVPPSIQTQFTTAFPSASDVRWEQNNQWYRATYKVGAHRMRMMYDMRGNSWALALPVTNGLIPDEVIEKAYTLYGDNVYDIFILKTAPKAVTMSPDTTMTTAAPTTDQTTAPTDVNANVSGTTTSTMEMGGKIYQVRIIENGVLRTELMNEDGTPFTESYWRVDSVDVNQMNMQQQDMQQQNLNVDTTQQTLPADTSSMQQDSTDQGITPDDHQNKENTPTPDPNAPSSDSSQPNQDATLPNSEPKLEK